MGVLFFKRLIAEPSDQLICMVSDNFKVLSGAVFHIDSVHHEALLSAVRSLFSLALHRPQLYFTTFLYELPIWT